MSNAGFHNISLFSWLPHYAESNLTKSFGHVALTFTDIKCTFQESLVSAELLVNNNIEKRSLWVDSVHGVKTDCFSSSSL